jgi:hypothetical protein
MRRPARLQPDPRRRKLGKERQHVAPPQLAPQNKLLRLVDPMQLKNTLQRIQPNANYLAHGRLPRLSFETCNSLILHMRCRRGPSTPTMTIVSRFDRKPL